MNPPASQFFSDSIFWIDIDKVRPNPFQPRKEFDELRLKDLAESIRMYGILQPLVVTRKEVVKPDGGLSTEYELISGERRLRASKIAGLSQVPTLIRASEESDRVKLELAIIENLQREDLNAVDRARAFQRLVEEFKFKHGQIAEKMGKSREYVTNTLRLLSMPPDLLDALSAGRISEGHARPLMMLNDRPEEQTVLFKEIILKKLTVREAEAIARRVAFDKIRKKERMIAPDIIEMEEKLTETLGTRVHIEQRDKGGKITIDYFGPDDLRTLMELIHKKTAAGVVSVKPSVVSSSQPVAVSQGAVATSEVVPSAEPSEPEAPVDDRSVDEKKADENDENLYSVNNFVV